MDGRFLATSGDYSTSFTQDFALNHIFDPRTGASPPGLSSVSVAARTGLLADGLTKPMMVLDLEAAQRLLDRYPGAGAVWIDKSAHVVANRWIPALDSRSHSSIRQARAREGGAARIEMLAQRRRCRHELER